jgi:7,8-dihydropterin-6-yl-methyl-4-(beta-D-ribofuranosyl)aminobenzene 5'-phosphate synthase
MSVLLGILVLLVLGPVGVFAFAQIRLSRGIDEAERAWREYEPRPIGDFGSTTSLSILPLVDWYASGPEFQTETGVSYLVQTDHSTILFDVGENLRKKDPSPLLHNMQTLGIGVDDFDTVVISHNHLDHVGGMKWSRRRTFSLGNEQRDLGSKRVFTPVPMTYPGLEPVHAKDPTVIAPGVATTGTIPRQLFIGRVEEQALVVNVAERGLVLIVGCGHQTVPKLLSRTRAVFSEPIHGLVGGLHYPVPKGRAVVLGLPIQKLVGSGNGPFSPLTVEEISANIAELRDLNLAVVGLSGHDSDDEVMEQFRTAFGSAYREVRVGEPIAVANPVQAPGPHDS